MSIYDDFAAARVEHLFFGLNGSHLAAACADMMADPDAAPRLWLIQGVKQSSLI